MSFASGWWYLEQSLDLGDHVSQALGGGQVLAQVSLIRAAEAVLPVTGPTATTPQEQVQHPVIISY